MRLAHRPRRWKSRLGPALRWTGSLAGLRGRLHSIPQFHWLPQSQSLRTVQERLQLVKQGYNKAWEQLQVKQPNQAVREQVLEPGKGRLSGTYFNHKNGQS